MTKESELDDLTAVVRGMRSAASPFRTLIGDLHKHYAACTEGTLANLGAETAAAAAGWFGIAAVDTSGQVYEVGESQQPFVVRSIVQPFVYGLALNCCGRAAVRERIGVAPTEDDFGFDTAPTHLPNPLTAAGALGVVTLLDGATVTERLHTILALFRHMTGREATVDAAVFTAARAQGHRYRALAHHLLAAGLIGDNLDETLDLFFQQQALLVTCRDLATMAATLANRGVNPQTGETVFAADHVQDILHVMYTCGMRRTRSAWTHMVGLPAESSASGAVLMVVPGQLGVAVFSPLLNADQHSIRGLAVCAALSEHFGLHIFGPPGGAERLRAALEGSRTGGRGSAANTLKI